MKEKDLLKETFSSCVRLMQVTIDKGCNCEELKKQFLVYLSSVQKCSDK